MKNKGRLFGILFLAMFIPGIISMNLRGLSGALLESPDFLQLVHEQAVTMKIAILFDLLAALFGILVSILIFPILKRYSLSLALGYIGIWLIQFALGGVGDMGHFSLISLSDKFVATADANPNDYYPLGYLMADFYYWGHFLALLLYSMGAAMMLFALVRLKLIPSLLGIWGMIAVSIVFTATMLQIFNQEVSMLLYVQNGIYLMVLGIWLTIKGFYENSNQSNELARDYAL